jgi:hypothetical protein
MALDPEALQNQTATASQQQRDAGYSQIELIARNMAELGWSKFFAKRRNLAKKYIKGAISIPSKNGEMAQGKANGKAAEYRSIQPEAWSDDMACTINVGLGTGSRDRDMAMLNVILNVQIGMADRLGAAGFKSKAIEFIPKIRKAAVQIAEASGLKNPDEYYPDITDEEIQAMIEQANQPRPDPAVALEQLKGENAKQLKDVDAQVSMKEAELKAQGDIVRNEAELAADLQTKEADRQNAIVIENIKAQNALALQQNNHAFQLQLESMKLANAKDIAAMKPAPQKAKPTKKAANA